MTLDMRDVRIDTYTGGDTTVRMTHLPTGVTATLIADSLWPMSKLKLYLEQELARRVSLRKSLTPLCGHETLLLNT